MYFDMKYIIPLSRSIVTKLPQESQMLSSLFLYINGSGTKTVSPSLVSEITAGIFDISPITFAESKPSILASNAPIAL